MQQYPEPSYRLGVPDTQGFQVPQSSFDRVSPGYSDREVPSNSDRLQYSIQHEVNHIMGSQQVHSSTLQQVS